MSVSGCVRAWVTLLVTLTLIFLFADTFRPPLPPSNNSRLFAPLIVVFHGIRPKASIISLHALHLNSRVTPGSVPQFTPAFLQCVSGYNVSYDPRIQMCIAALETLRAESSRLRREAVAGSGDTTYEGIWNKYPGLE